MRLIGDAEEEEQALVGAQKDLARQPGLAGSLIVEVELRDAAELVLDVRDIVRKVLASAYGLLRLRRSWRI